MLSKEFIYLFALNNIAIGVLLFSIGFNVYQSNFGVGVVMVPVLIISLIRGARMIEQENTRLLKAKARSGRS